MNELDPRIIRAGEVITKSNRAILAKEELATSEVKWYLSEWLRAGSILTEEDPLPIGTAVREGNPELQQALGAWNSDRSLALVLLVSLTGENYRVGRLESEEACARCVIALLQEPLIPSINLEKYQEIVRLATHALMLEKETTSNALILSVCAAGVLYNTARFCPQMLPMVSDVITEEDIKDYQGAFLAGLEALQGRALYSGN